MSKRSAVLSEKKWYLLRIALWRNHLQERKDNFAAEVQANYALYDRHRREMALLSILINPLGLTLTINRYTKQLTELGSVNKFRRSLLKARQAQECTDLERWIHQQQTQRDEALIFSRFSKQFGWSLSRQQRSHYHQSLANGFTLILTDTKKSILWASQQFLVMTGYMPKDVLGKTPQFLQGPGTNQVTVQYIREQLMAAQEVEADLINYRKNGEPYLCHLRITPLCNAHGELTHYLAVEHED